VAKELNYFFLNNQPEALQIYLIIDKFGKLVHLVGYLKEIYYDAR
jgi:hypothetical protein